ncbi:unnamed protein product [Bemisia tabaci]|uniref:Uncharacterized protein n=1 Tax=Bemisia tabaci TaxID=7038 RepID=A0A9P0F195_BEMTA|nr:unnamed protein product [Bemisia tabaci]
MMEDLIENRCRQLCRRKSSVRKGSALHLSDWLKGRLGAGGNMNDEPPSPEEEMEIWSRETLHARMKKLRAPNLTEILPRNESRMEDLEFSEYSRSASRCTINSQSQETEDDSDEGEDLPYQVLPSTFLKRYDTMSSLEKLDREQDSDEPAKTSGVVCYIISNNDNRTGSSDLVNPAHPD